MNKNKLQRYQNPEDVRRRRKSFARVVLVVIILILLCLCFRSCRARDEPVIATDRVYEEDHYKTQNTMNSNFNVLALQYAGTVSWGVRREIIKALTKGTCPFKEKPKTDGDVVWCKPERTCIVEFRIELS